MSIPLLNPLSKGNINKFNYLILANKLNEIIKRDQNSQNPVFTFVKKDFILKLAQKISIHPENPLAIAVTGESAAGKSTFVRIIASEIEKIQSEFNKNLLTFVSADNYFKDISKEIKEHGSFDAFLAKTNYNPDDPKNFQLSLMKKDLQKLLDGNNIKIPEYKVNGTGISVPDSISVKASRVILSEGIFVLCKEVRDIFDIKIYIDIEEKERKERYIQRAVEKRNQTPQNAIKQWDKVNESAIKFLRPSKKHADLIINGSARRDDYIKITDEIFMTIYRFSNSDLFMSKMA